MLYPGSFLKLFRKNFGKHLTNLSGSAIIFTGTKQMRPASHRLTRIFFRVAEAVNIKIYLKLRFDLESAGVVSALIFCFFKI